MKNQEIALLVGELKGGMAALEEQVKTANGKLDSLPCAAHTTEIKELKTWKQTCNGVNANRRLESFKGMISLRNAIIICAMTGILSVLVTLLTSFFFIGKS